MPPTLSFAWFNHARLPREPWRHPADRVRATPRVELPRREFGGSERQQIDASRASAYGNDVLWTTPRTLNQERNGIAGLPTRLGQPADGSRRTNSSAGCPHSHRRYNRLRRIGLNDTKQQTRQRRGTTPPNPESPWNPVPLRNPVGSPQHPGWSTFQPAQPVHFSTGLDTASGPARSSHQPGTVTESKFEAGEVYDPWSQPATKS